MRETGEIIETAVEVEFLPSRAPAFAATVTLIGEHDLATSPQIRDALAPIDGNVLLDLSECDFIDSSVLYVIVSAMQEREREGKRLELVVPPGNVRVLRTLEITGVLDVVTVHPLRDIS
jgi:anti-anti-sigma factor